MSNPFPSKRDRECDRCAGLIEVNENIFSVPSLDNPEEREFVCTPCAIEGDNVCECGNAKKPEFEVCYECYEKR